MKNNKNYFKDKINSLFLTSLHIKGFKYSQNQIFLKKVVSAAAVFFILASIIFISCSNPEKRFGEIVISSHMQEGNLKPEASENKFDFNVKEIYASVEYFGVTGKDDWKFRWIDKNTGQLILQKADQFSKEKPDSYFKGIVSSSIKPGDESKIIPPGVYKVEFYIDNEIIKTADFEIIKPEMEILGLQLANKVNEKGYPVSISQTFEANETIFVCININYLMKGNTLKAIWKENDDTAIDEEIFELNIDYYNSTYVNFKLDSKETSRQLAPGKYKVEIYLNDDIYDTLDFEIEKTDLITFNQNVTYSNDEYGFAMNIPDNWSFKERKEKDFLYLNLIPEENIYADFFFSVMPAKSISPVEEFTRSDAEKLALQHNLQFVDVIQGEYKLKGKYDTTEIIYLYQDENKDNYAMAYSITEKNETAFVFTVMSAQSDNDDIAGQAYGSILNSLVFY